MKRTIHRWLRIVAAAVFATALPAGAAGLGDIKATWAISPAPAS